jgi:voltage-gated potassium channel
MVLWLEMPEWLYTVLVAELIVAWVVFLVDYIVRLARTKKGERGLFVSKNLIDLLSVIVPVFRAFRVINLLRNIEYFQRRSGTAVRVTIITFGLAYAVIFIYFMALTTLQAERFAEGATITDFGQAIWWAVVTVATVGYGDTYPITTAGRLSAVVLMIGGVAIIGTASALVLSYITERVTGQARRPDELEKELEKRD